MGTVIQRSRYGRVKFDGWYHREGILRFRSNSVKEALIWRLLLKTKDVPVTSTETTSDLLIELR